MRFRLIPALVVLGAFAAALAWRQDREETPVFRVTSSRVVVDFIAIDGDTGRLVRDLKPRDLEIRVDGKKQNVDFLVPPSEALGSGYVTAGQLASSSGAGAGAGPSQPLEGGGTALRTAIVLDSRVMDAANHAHSIAAIREFIEQSLSIDSPVMLAEIDRGLKIISPLTRDREKLLAALDKLQPASVYNPLDRDRLLRNLGSDYFDELFKQVGYLREGLTELCYLLSGSPGRKHIVFFSEGYPVNPIKELEIDSRRATALSSADARQQASRTVASRKDPNVLGMVREVVSLANTFGISFYSVDARGLVAVPALGAADIGSRDIERRDESGQPRGVLDTRPAGDPFEAQVTTFQLTRISTLDDAQNTLIALSGGTNGTAFFNSNNLGVVLRASFMEQNLNYRASFVPKLKGDPKFRRLQVKCKRKGVLIRSQAGFTDFSGEQLLNLQLAAVLKKPENFRALQPVLDIQTASGGGEAVIGVQGARIGARRQDGMYHVEVLFIGQIFDADDKAVSDEYPIKRGFQVDLTEEQFRSLAQQPLLARQELKLRPGKYRAVMAAVDAVAGSLGGVSREFSVP